MADAPLLTEHDISARWAAFTVRHPDAEILVEPATWLERVRAYLNPNTWTLDQIRRALGLSEDYRVRLTSRGDLHVWLPKQD